MMSMLYTKKRCAYSVRTHFEGSPSQPPLVFESPVRSGYLPLLALTETVTG